MDQTGSNPQTTQQIKAVAIIPARFNSTRLPGKALLEIAGKPMICWVVERALAARNVSRVIVATDDSRIRDAVQTAGYEAMMTRSDHQSGTDRLAEVAAELEYAAFIVNIQVDEPLIASETIERAVAALGSEAQEQTPEGAQTGIVTTWEPIDSVADVLNADVVKVVLDEDERAVYFSRSPVPYPCDAIRKYGTLAEALNIEPGLLRKFKKHTGLYVYRRDVLLKFTTWPQTQLERIESLEQLRALEHGVKIKAIKASTPSIGVDTKEDLERVRTILEGQRLGLPV